MKTLKDEWYIVIKAYKFTILSFVLSCLCYQYVYTDSMKVCQTICDVTSSNVIRRLVLCKHKGWWDRERWLGTPRGWKQCGLTVKIPQLGHFSYFECSHFTS